MKKITFLFIAILHFSVSAQVATIAESFESVTALPSDWSTNCANCSASVLTGLQQDGVKSLRVEPGTIGVSTSYLILPRVNDTKGSLSFYAAGYNYQTGNPVAIIQVGTVSSPTNIASFASKTANIFLYAGNQNVSLNLSANTNGHEYIAIKMQSQTFADFYQFDNFTYSSQNLTLGIADSSTAKSFSVYPIPAKNILTIDSQEEILKVVIYDMAGKEVKTFSNSSNYNVESLKTGIYILEITTEKGKKSTKFSKK